MSSAGSDQDAHAWFDRNDLVVQLHLGIRSTFQKEVSLGECLVIMKLCCFRYLCYVKRRWKVGNISEGSACDTTGTRLWRNLVKVCDLIGWHRFWLLHGLLIRTNRTARTTCGVYQIVKPEAMVNSASGRLRWVHAAKPLKVNMLRNVNGFSSSTAGNQTQWFLAELGQSFY